MIKMATRCLKYKVTFQNKLSMASQASKPEDMDESKSLADYEDNSDSVVECINGHLGTNSQSGVSDSLANAKLEVSLNVAGAK